MRWPHRVETPAHSVLVLSLLTYLVAGQSSESSTALVPNAAPGQVIRVTSEADDYVTDIETGPDASSSISNDSGAPGSVEYATHVIHAALHHNPERLARGCGQWLRIRHPAFLIDLRGNKPSGLVDVVSQETSQHLLVALVV